jgi:putative membrane protein
MMLEAALGAGALKLPSVAKLVIHVFLAVYGLILAFILAGLIFNFNIQAQVFFDLSFALLIFTLAQCFYELGVKNGLTFLVVTSVTGFLFEILGTSTGFPFGKYYYTDFLGPKVLGVPEVVPLVWFVIAYLTFSIARGMFGNQKLSSGHLARLALLGAFGAVSWDFLVDPMFSSYGYWVWTGQFFPLPELDGIPLTNFVGWFVLVTLMLSIYLFISKSGQGLGQRQNLLDSRLAYIFLLVDGIVANDALQNYNVIALGTCAMIAFMVISYYARVKPKKIEQIIK